MAAASYEVYFKAPIQATTTTSPYRTTSRPAIATGCSAVMSADAGEGTVRVMADPFAACNVAWPGLTVPWAAVGHHLGDEIFICCPPPPPARPEPGRRRTV